MEGTAVITGFDSVQLDGRIISDFADGDNAVLSFPNDISNVKASKNGNTLYAKNETGRLAELTLRILIGSADDKWLNSRWREWDTTRGRFRLFTGSLLKRAGDGQANVSEVVYQVSGGAPKKNVEAKSNADGDVEQSVAIYTMTVAAAPRSIQ